MHPFVLTNEIVSYTMDIPSIWTPPTHKLVTDIAISTPNVLTMTALKWMYPWYTFSVRKSTVTILRGLPPEPILRYFCALLIACN